MPTITSLGVGSGLDLNTIVTQLVAVERQPLAQMQKSADRLQTGVSTFGRISSLLGSLQTASQALKDPALWTRTTIASSDAASVSATTDGAAASGNYSVAVQSLAQAQTLASGSAFPSAGELVGSGTLVLETGTWASDTGLFTPASGSPVTLTVSATDTLQTLRDKINGAGAGVSASLVTDASGVRLSLQSTATGAANGFRVTANDSDGSDTDANGLSRFAYDPSGGATSMQQVQAAANASATVNGIAIDSASNNLSGVVEGLTLNLLKVTTSPVTVVATPDRAAVTSAVQSFASAYSALATELGNDTKYDAATKIGGPLQGDSAATGLQSRLRALLGATSGASATFRRLSDVGLRVQRDGTLSVDQATLTSAASNLAELKKAFTAADASNAGNDGFATVYNRLAAQALGVDGLVTTRTAALRKLISTNSDAQAALNDRVDTFQKRLVAQYTSLDSKVAQLNSLSSYVTQQLSLMNKSNKN